MKVSIGGYTLGAVFTRQVWLCTSYSAYQIQSDTNQSNSQKQIKKKKKEERRTTTVFYCFSKFNWLMWEPNDCCSWNREGTWVKKISQGRAEGRFSYSVIAVACGFSSILKSTVMNVWQKVTSSNQINTVWSNNTDSCCKTCLVIFLPNTHSLKKNPKTSNYEHFL